MGSGKGIIQINLTAVRDNWLMVRKALSAGAECAAVVKANAYGLGVAPVVQALFSAGCRTFFVARLEEARELKRFLPANTTIYVLQGVPEGKEATFIRHGLIPVIISLPMFKRWHKAAAGKQAPCALKVNTGMNRLGMAEEEFFELVQSPQLLREAAVEMVVSHLACADNPEHPLNNQQLQRFQSVVSAIRAELPDTRASLANSAGVFLGDSWHFTMARPGIALYGGCPQLDQRVQPRPVVTLKVPVLQVRALAPGEAVGYGAEFRAARPMTVAVVFSGYADGFMRSLNGRMQAWFHRRLPLLGRVSMDSMVFDVTDLTDEQCPGEGDMLELIGPNITLDEFAGNAQTSTYEVLTRLGGRLQKEYVEEGEM